MDGSGSGIDALHATWSEAIRQAIEPRFEREERIVSGDLAVGPGWDVQTLRPRGGGAARTQRQRVLMVLRRGPDGRWRYARGMSQAGPDTE